MELAFYAPLPSRPPPTEEEEVGGGAGMGGGRRRRRAAMAGPVPIDVDGDGAYDSLVVPARLTRSDVVRGREAEGGGGRRRPRCY